MSQRPLISIIMPSYNSTKYIECAVDSIIAQTLPDWELLIIDDASTDHTVSLIHDAYPHDSRIKIISLTENGGAAIARNTGIKAAKGRYIAFLDSDDSWLPTKLEKQIAFHQNPDVHFSFTAYIVMTETGEHTDRVVRAPGSVTYKDMLSKCHIGCLTAMYDTKTLGKIFMPLIKKRQDYGLWLKILRKTPFAHYIDTPLSLYRKSSNSLSANKPALIRYHWLLFRHHENFPAYKTVWYVTKNIVNKLIDIRKK